MQRSQFVTTLVVGLLALGGVAQAQVALEPVNLRELEVREQPTRELTLDLIQRLGEREGSGLPAIAKRAGFRVAPVIAPFGPPCVITCPPAGIDEGETCGDSTNDGCSIGFCEASNFIVLSGGETYCGNVYAEGGVRDLDWYQITVDDVTTLEIEVNSEFPSLFGLAEALSGAGDCTAFLLLATGTSGDCTPTTISRTVFAGTYYVFLGAGDDTGPIFEGIPCSSDSKDYTITVDALAADCLPACTGIVEAEACGADSNGGCDPGGGPAFASETMAVGDTFCGTSRTYFDAVAMADARDIDWITFTLASDAEVTIDVSSEFPALWGLTTVACPTIDLLDVGTSAGGCVPGSVVINLAAGDYSIFVGAGDEFGPIFGDGPVDCADPANGYQVTVTSGPPPAACTLTCPSGASDEGEPCGSDANDICVGTSGFNPVFASVGDTYCGQLYADGARDFDFYQITLSSPTELTIDFASKLPASVSITQIADPVACTFFILDEDLVLSTGDCATGTGTSGATLAPGDYLIAVTTGGLATGGIFAGFPCGGGNNDYVISFSTTGAPGCVFPSGTVATNCNAGTIDFDLLADACYDDIDYEITDADDVVVDSGTFAGPFAVGDVIMESSAVISTPGVYDVVVTANCCNGETDQGFATIFHAQYGGETDIIFQAEAGCVDSGAALEAALTANGRTVLTIPFAVDVWDCLTEPGIQTIWVLRGTFPNNVPLSEAEGAALNGVVVGQGVSVYLEGGDIWGFDPLTPFADIDGVAGRQVDGNLMVDGDDSFTSMEGAGITGSFGTVTYNQDNRNPAIFGGVDFTDQLLLSGDPIAAVEDDPAGSVATAIWVNVDDGIPDPVAEDAYITGIFYEPSDSGWGRVISQSWEFGGFDGDQVGLAGAYLGALKNIVPGDEFKRGDANSDGGYDISDAIFSLSALFVPGSPQPGCLDAADANDDGGFDISDAIYTLSALFVPGSPLPPDPGASACGDDPTDDAIECAVYVFCP